ncbi:MAG: hypothetical protein Q4F12_05105 [Erysipelotrichaceae bacterium]|nr:hypothetical protein [Erysipelotrichaceae bacterium]
MKKCCIFESENPQEAIKHRKFELVKNYGRKDGNRYLFMWDDGERYLCRCKNCGRLVLVQESEMHMPDHTYYDYLPVESIQEADEINAKYDGGQFESKYWNELLFETFDW